MKKHFLLFTGLILGAALSVAGVGIAQPHGHGGRSGPGFGHHGAFGPGAGMGEALFRMAAMLDRVADEIGLTEEQRDQIRTIVNASRDELRPVGESLRDNHRAIREASDPETYDPAVIAQLATEQGDLVAQLIVIKSRIRVDIFNVLTPEQRDQLRELREERFGH